MTWSCACQARAQNQQVKTYLAMIAASFAGTDVASLTQISATDPRSAIKAAGFVDSAFGTPPVVEIEPSRDARLGPGKHEHVGSEWSDALGAHERKCGTA